MANVVLVFRKYDPKGNPIVGEPAIDRTVEDDRDVRLAVSAEMQKQGYVLEGSFPEEE